MKDKISHSAFRLYRPVHLLVLVGVAGALLTSWIVVRTDREMRADWLQVASQVAQAIDEQQLLALGGTEADLKKPEYSRLKDQLVTTRQAYPSYRFMYLLARRPAGEIFFVADSEPVDSKDYSPPGQPYPEVSEVNRLVFENKVAVMEGPVRDRWGMWMAALVPLVDPKTGAVIAVMGADIDARDWYWRLGRAALPSALLAVVLGGIWGAGRMLLLRRSRLDGVAPRWMKRLEAQLVGAVGLVLTLTTAWSLQERESRDRKKAFEQLATSRTEVIAEKLRTVGTVELEALARFCESRPPSTPQEFGRFAGYLTANPVVQAWEWIPVVPAADRSRFEAMMREQGRRDFSLWQRDAGGPRVPAADRAAYYPVQYAVPEAGNEHALGFDLGSEPRRRKAIEEAARSGQCTATDPIGLVQENGAQWAMLICRPVPGGDAARPLRGLALAALRMGALLQTAAPDEAALMDLSLLHPGAPPEGLAHSGDAAGVADPELDVTRPVFAFGRVFALTARAGPEFIHRHPVRVGALTAVTGSILTITLAGVVSMLLRRSEDLERVVAERTAALRWNQQLLQRMTASSPLAFLVVDNRSDEILYFNRRFTEIWGIESLAERMRRGEMKHGEIMPHCRPMLADEPAYATTLASLQDEASRLTIEDEIAFTGHRTVHRYSTQIRDEEDRYCGRLFIFEDITPRKAHEAKTIALLEREKQISEMKTRFIALTSHEFRTPMAAAMGSVELLANHYEQLVPVKRQDLLQRINSSLRRMTRMLDDILLLNRIDRQRVDVNPVPVKLRAFLGDLIEEVRLGDHDAHRFVFETPGGEVSLVADADLLHHIFANVLGNAVRYSGPGTTIGVRLAGNAERVQVAVEDHGIGIPAADRTRIFEPFERGSNVGLIGGTGLGLNIVKRTSELLGGSVTVDEAAGGGSRFTLTFPLSPSSSLRT